MGGRETQEIKGDEVGKGEECTASMQNARARPLAGDAARCTLRKARRAGMDAARQPETNTARGMQPLLQIDDADTDRAISVLLPTDCFEAQTSIKIRIRVRQVDAARYMEVFWTTSGAISDLQGRSCW